MIKVGLTGMYGIGKSALLSDEDKHLASYVWHVHKTGYPKRFDRSTKRNISMHQDIVRTRQGLEVDHINRDKLDNRRENLRVVSRTINTNNAKLRKDNTSSFRGVSWDKNAKKWAAQISIGGKTYRLSLEDNPEMAYAIFLVARAYKEKIITFLENQRRQEGINE